MKNFLLRSNKTRNQNIYKILRCQLFSTSPPQLDTLYTRISRVSYPANSAKPVIDKWLQEGKSIKPAQLQAFVKKFRKYRRFPQALQVLEWLTSREGYKESPANAAVRLDLISKVHGLESAEEYFNSIPETLKGYHLYGALLNCYAEAKDLEKAEAVMLKLKDLQPKNFLLSYNVMLSLYVRLGKYENIDPLIQEMEENGIHADVFTNNIRLNAYVNSSDIEGMEKFLIKKEAGENGSINFHSYVIVANGYLKAGLTNKGLCMLKKSEQLIKNEMRKFSYEMLLPLYAAAGEKAEVDRIWGKYKEIGRFFNTGYLTIISSLMKLNDIDGAEKIWEEWNSGKALFDIRVPNLMIHAYSKKGLWEKAEMYINKIRENGQEPDAASWDNLAGAYINGGEEAKAVEAVKKAILADKPNRRPRLFTTMACLLHLKGQGEIEKAEELLKMAKVSRKFGAATIDKLSNYVNYGNISALEQVEDEDQSFAEEPPTTLEASKESA